MEVTIALEINPADGWAPASAIVIANKEAKVISLLVIENANSFDDRNEASFVRASKDCEERVKIDRITYKEVQAAIHNEVKRVPQNDKEVQQRMDVELV